MPPRDGEPAVYTSAEVDGSEMTVIIGVSFTWDAGQFFCPTGEPGDLSTAALNTLGAFWGEITRRMDEDLYRAVHSPPAGVSLEEKLLPLVLPLREEIERIICWRILAMRRCGADDAGIETHTGVLADRQQPEDLEAGAGSR